LKWDSFIGQRNGQLPPLANKPSPPPTTATTTFVTEISTHKKLEPISEQKSAAPTTVEQDKNLLKGKPIIFVGGGPGRSCIKTNIFSEFRVLFECRQR